MSRLFFIRTIAFCLERENVLKRIKILAAETWLFRRQYTVCGREHSFDLFSCNLHILHLDKMTQLSLFVALP